MGMMLLQGKTPGREEDMERDSLPTARERQGGVVDFCNFFVRLFKDSDDFIALHALTGKIILDMAGVVILCLDL
jgi:hypothetical protein